MSEDKGCMPFTGHPAAELHNILTGIAESDLSVELFDAFLAEYRRTGDLATARFFAACEWDC